MNLHPAVRALGLALLAVAGPVGGQAYTTSLGPTFGASLPGDLTRGTDQSTTLDPGWTAGLQLERWWGSGWAGTRLSGSYARRSPADDAASAYQLLSADLALVSRLVPPVVGNTVVPFAGVGIGAIAFRAVDGAGPLGGGALGGDPVVRPAVTVSLGADLFASSRVGLRLEVLDQVVVPALDGSGGGQTHNLEARAALQLRMHRVRPPAVVAAAAPPPTVASPTPAYPELVAALERLEARLDEQAAVLDRLTHRMDGIERQMAEERARRMDPPVATAEPAPAPVPAPTAPPAVPPPASPPTPAATAARFTVQIGSYADVATANRLADQARALGLPVRVTRHQVSGRTVHRVRIGATTTLAEAERVARLLRQGYGFAIWIDRIAAGEAVPEDAVQATARLIRPG